MLNEYQTKFEEMYMKIKQNESPSKVVMEYTPDFEKEGISPLEVISYLNQYVRRENCRL